MENDQRLTPLPVSGDLHTAHHDYASGYSSFYDDEAFESKRSIRQYLNIIYKRLPLILALTILVTAAAAFYMYRLPSQYQATTEMVIEPRKPKVQSKDSININFGNDANYYQTQLQLLQSPDLMKDVVIDLGLYRDPNLSGNSSRGLFSSLRSIFSGGKKAEDKENSLPVVSDNQAGSNDNVKLTPEQNARAEAYAAQISSGLKVDQIERTNIVNITVTNTNPEVAAKVADGVARLFQKQDAERETQGAKQAYEDLSKSIEDLKATISDQEAQLIDSMQRYKLPLAEKGGDLAASRLQTMSEQWMTAMDDRRKLEARYNTAIQANSRGEAMNIPDISESKIVQDAVRLNAERKAKLQDQIRDIDKQIQTAETERAELLVKYNPEYAPVKQNEEKIASLKAAKEKSEEDVAKIIDTDQKKTQKDAISGTIVSLKAQLDSAKNREAQLLASYNQEAAHANVQGTAMTALTTQKREIETNRSLLDAYIQRQKEQELSIQSNQPDNISITSNAVVPTSPIGPQRNRNILVAFLLSLCAGVGLALLMDYLDDSVKSSDDISRHLGLPTLALIPQYAGVEKRRLSLAPKNGNGAIASTAALITLEETRSPMAEAYRHLRTSLLFSSAGKPPQTILVTSSQPSEGKTTTAINTAITLAQADADVVLIDCDLRRPRLHSHFQMDNSHGLTNYLSGERHTENLLKTYPDLPRLKVITSGPIPPNPTELLGSNEMRNLLQFLKGRFKHVVIDSPPAISFTDAAILSTIVDGVVLVAMAGKSSVHLMRRFKQRLGTIGARIYGVVLNGIKSGSVEYEYYGAGYYNYYKAAEDDDSTPLMEEVESIHSTKG